MDFTKEEVKYLKSFAQRHIEAEKLEAKVEKKLVEFRKQILSGKLKTPGPPILSNLICQHKYYSRIYQKRVVATAVPEFFLIDPSDKKYGGPSFFPVFK